MLRRLIWRILPALALLTLVGCARQTSPSEYSPPPPSTSGDHAVRAAIAEILKAKPDQVSLDTPMGRPPLTADDLDVIEIVMSTEERLDVDISDEELDKAAGITNPTELTATLTPRMLMQVADRAMSQKKK